MATKIQGITIEINGDTTGLNTALSKIDSNVKNTSKELSQINNALKFNPGNAELMAQKLQVISEKSAELKTKLDALKQASGQVEADFASGKINADQYRAFQRELIVTESQLKNLDKELDGHGSKWTALGDKVKAAGPVIAAAAGAAIVAAGAAVVKLGIEAVKGYAELEQNLGGTAAVFAGYSSTIEQAATSAYRTMGASQNEYLATANKIGALLQGQGIEQERSAELTVQALTRAADAASVMGIDVSVALEAITGAAKGNYSMMDNLGVAMNVTTLKAYALEQGMAKTWETMTQAEKAELAMKYFFENTTQYAGNFEREASQTITGSINMLKTATANWISSLAGDADTVRATTQEMVDAFFVMTENVIPVVETLIENLPIAFEKIRAAIEPKLPEIIDTVVKFLADSIPVIIDAGVVLLSAIVENLPAIIGNIAGKIPDIVAGIFKAFMSLLGDMPKIGLAIIEGIGKGLIQAAQGIYNTISGIVSKITGLFGRANTATRNTQRLTKSTSSGGGLRMMAASAAAPAEESPGFMAMAAARVTKAIEPERFEDMGGVVSRAASLQREESTAVKLMDSTALINGLAALINNRPQQPIENYIYLGTQQVAQALYTPLKVEGSRLGVAY